jgi:hypothetical protein
MAPQHEREQLLSPWVANAARAGGLERALAGDM